MFIRTSKPDMPLGAFVDHLWYLESRHESCRQELSLPDGAVDLIIDLTTDKVRLGNATHGTMELDPMFVCGPHSEHFIIYNTPVTRVIGVHFKPGGAYPFIGCPLDRLHNAIVPLDAMWGRLAAELRDELLEQPSVDRMFHTLARRLVRHAVKPLEPHPAVRYALSRLDDMPDDIRHIVDRIGLSHKRFIDVFKRETGLTPKRYGRIRRFQDVLQHIHSRPQPADWTAIALDCGYCDQSHFIKEFQAFSGLKPSDYEPVPGKHYNHVPG